MVWIKIDYATTSNKMLSGLIQIRVGIQKTVTLLA